ncbi:helix-turn-helix transcriptional regulator [Enterococcus sp. 669A]|uniref:Helix-turn-helix transcriptional regulator n=1 Tax=Candidatus Enterococcus moelleringii TaxID=2815325 RepID=A0ABS3LEA8_9ENTE|nr:helix-turn-helix transcriptional regulator [Enterococcus sp. 669A]
MLAKNIIKYRKKNNLTQTQLAEELKIARQSISKWETGENLPSIDNLILLSEILNISLDELITGSPYLPLPFDFGKPKSRKALIILGVMASLPLLSFIGLGSIEEVAGDFFRLLLVSALMIVLSVYGFPFDFKRYYNYWRIEKTGLVYATPHLRSLGISGSLDELILPLKALFGQRKTRRINYQDIQSMELILVPFRSNPTLGWSPRGYTPRLQQLMRESFYLKVVTKNGDEIYLELRQYYMKDSKERELFLPIILFFKRKNFDFIDQGQIIEKLRSGKNVLEGIYAD